MRSYLVHLLRLSLKDHEKIKRLAIKADMRFATLQYCVARVFPRIIRPRPRQVHIAVTSNCNLRCIGCRYGRDFMPGHQLSLDIILQAINDASKAGIDSVHFLGGEPLLHPELPQMIRYAKKKRLAPYITTNGILLKDKAEELYDAGLRFISVGYYGVDNEYDQYVQRSNYFTKFQNSLAFVRDRFESSIDIQLNYLISRPSCSEKALSSAWRLARRYNTTLKMILVHYSFPYFTQGPDQKLKFTFKDRPRIEKFVNKIVELKTTYPERINESLPAIRSITDWLIKGPAMCLPCDAYQMISIGADGTVQLCDVTFKLGNLYEQRLSEILYGKRHYQAARDAFTLNCPNCHCRRETRIQKYAPGLYLTGQGQDQGVLLSALSKMYKKICPQPNHAPKEITLYNFPLWAIKTVTSSLFFYQRKKRPINFRRFVNFLRPNLRKPIFIIGAARSGTTFLGNCLGSIPEISYHHEPVLTKAAARYVYQGKWSGWKAAVFYKSVYSWLMRMYFDADLRFAEKTPRNSCILNFLAETFSDAQFVFIIRDGRDAALSHSKQPWLSQKNACSGRYEPGGYREGPYAHFWVEPNRVIEFETTSDIHRCIWAWRSFNQQILEFKSKIPSDRGLTIKYENLVSHPIDTGNRLLDFLNIYRPESRAECQKRLMTSQTTSIVRWKTELSAEDLNRINKEAGELLRKLGYAE